MGISITSLPLPRSMPSTMQGMPAQRWRDRARKLLSSHRSGGTQEIVAFTTRGNRICSIGFNSYSKTHPRQASSARLAGQPERKYLHAEIAALLRSPAYADTLVVCRFDKQGNPVSAAPCPVCRIAISLFNPGLRIFHT